MSVNSLRSAPGPPQTCSPIMEISTSRPHDEHLMAGIKLDSLGKAILASTPVVLLANTPKLSEFSLKIGRRYSHAHLRPHQADFRRRGLQSQCGCGGRMRSRGRGNGGKTALECF